jgi:small conductance mechanosensitive channel
MMFTETLLEGSDLIRIGIAMGIVVILAYIASQAAARAARALFVNVVQSGPEVGFTSPIVKRPIRIVRLSVFLATLAALGLPALDVAGVHTATGTSESLRVWFFGSGLRIVVIATLTYLVVRIVSASVRRLEEEISRGEGFDAQERLKRARTISGLIQQAVTAFVIAIAILMILRELRVDIMPILTGAGILGLAVGFGAQTLVKDFIAGFFLTIENRVRVGDVATINGTGGLVESVNLRTTVLRDLEGTVHVFPNGSVETLANHTKDFSYYVIDMGVAYKEDTDNVVAVLREVAADLQADSAFGPHILEPLEVLGVDSFDDSQVVVKVRIKTVPLKQWAVGRELRRRIKMTFDARGIEIPFPHLSLYFGEASKPILFQQAAVSEGR